MSINPFDIAEKQYSERNQSSKKSEVIPFKNEIQEDQYSNIQNEESFEETEKEEQKKRNVFDVAEGFYQEKNPQENEIDLERDIERNIAQQTSRMLEGIIGLPSDLINFAGGLFGYDPGLPGSQKLQEFSEFASQGYTKPRNENEEKFGNLAKDMALFAMPGASHYNLVRNIGIPIASELAKEGVKYLGGGGKSQSAANIGSMVVLDLISGRKALGNSSKYASSLFKKSDELLPKGVSVKASNLENSLIKLEDKLKAGGSRPSTSEALEKIKEIRNEIVNGKVNLKNLAAYRPSINEMIDKFKGFEFGITNPKIKNRIIQNLQEVKGNVIKTLEEYGKKFNPEYLKTSRSANEAYSAIEGSKKISNFIEKHSGSKIKSILLKSMLGLVSGGSVAGATALGGLGIGSSLGLLGAGGYKAFQTILKMKSPALRKHYFDILKGAASGNAAVVSTNIKKLDKAFQEMEETGELMHDQ